MNILPSVVAGLLAAPALLLGNQAPPRFSTTEGTVKVLDFGIARILGSSGDQEVEPSPSSIDIDNLALNDVTDSATRTGTILGTPAYMSPEQAAGE